VVPRHGENRSPEALEQRSRPLVLVRTPAVRQVPRDDDKRRGVTSHELAESRSERLVIAGADVEIGDVNEADWHDRGTLYTQIE
jgi:hypothetical protein